VPPKFVRPCILMTAKTVPEGNAWLHEPKLDDYRFQIVKDGRRVRHYGGAEYFRYLSPRG
jgi:ATP-dependent DNA ligase